MRGRGQSCVAFVIFLVCGAILPAHPSSAAPRNAVRVAPPTGSSAAAAPAREPSRVDVAAPAREPSGVDVAAAIETVEHHIDPRTLRVDDRRYRLTLGRAFALAMRGGSRTRVPVTARAARVGPEVASVRASAPAPFERSAAIEIATRSIAVGGVRRTVVPGRWTTDRNIASRRLARGVTERVTARDGDVEWDVVLDRDPRGDVSIAAEVEGARAPKVVTDAPAHDMRLPAPALRWSRGDRAVRMGEMVVVDAAGRELYRALPRATRTGVTLQVPRAVFDGARYPVTIDPVVSPEYEAGNAVYVEASDGSDPAVSWNGTNWLVVWASSSTSDIIGARMAPDGTLLDPRGFAVTTQSGSQGSPAVAWNGSVWLVVWGSSGIHGARVDASGVVQESLTTPIAISSTSASFEPAVASDASGWFVAFTSSRNYSTSGYDIYGTRVSASGSVTDGSGSTGGLALATATGDQRVPDVASVGSAYLTVWQDARNGGLDIYGTRVTSAGSVQDAGGFVISTATNAQSAPAVIGNGTEYLVAWTDGRGTSNDIYGTRVTTSGTLTDGTAGVALRAASGDQNRPSLAWNGSMYLLAWNDTVSGPNTSTAYAYRLSASLTVQDSAPINVGYVYFSYPVAGGGGSSFLVVWSYGGRIKGARVTDAGVNQDTTARQFNTTAEQRAEPELAWNGSSYLVTWQHDDNWYDVRAVRLDSRGALLDQTALVIDATSDFDYLASVASDGRDWFVVWNRSNDIYGRFVRADGTMGASFLVSGGTANKFYPRAAWDGTNYLVVWEDRGADSGDIAGTRVSPSGTVLDGANGFTIVQAVGAQSQPRIAWNGTRYLVVWDDFRNGANLDVYAARVAANATVEDAGGIAVAAFADSQTQADVAASGSTFLVVWQDERPTTGSDIYAARVSSAGAVLDAAGFAIVAGTASPSASPVVGYNGVDFVVAWKDNRSGTDIYAARVSTGGSVRDPSGIGVQTASGSETAPALARGPYGRVLIAYQRTPAGSAESQVYFRILDAPMNDTFTSVRSISGSSGSIDGVNSGATVETGEPSIVGGGGASVWYSWTAPASKLTTFDTNGSDYDTVLAIYTGSAVNALTLVTQDDDSGTAPDSRVTFTPTAGTNYRIRVDGYAGATGWYLLNWLLDDVAPDTTITSAPSGAVPSTSASFSFASSEGGSTFECKLDTAAYSACTSPKGYAGLSQGAHDFLVRATDPAGNVDATPALASWTVDTVAPDTTITSGPTGTVTSASATFTFASSESPATFQCSLDGAAFTSCATPKAYSALSEGAHTFSVRALDAASNADASAATRSWTVDTLAPDTTISSAPANPTNSTSASFAFTSPDPGATFQCTLDGGAYLGCTSPKAYAGLSNGGHTFAVRALDAAGNADASPASFAWTVDTVAPDTTLTAQPANPTNSTSATFSFTATEAGTFQCSLDGSAYTSCVSPKSYSGLATGSHTFSVRAVDAATNADASPSSFTWVIDTAPPDTTITAGPSGAVSDASATFSFGSTEAPATFRCSLDGSAFTTCASPRTYTALNDGTHTFQVQSIDAAGNADPTAATRNWSVDTTAPNTTIAVAPPSPTSATSATFEFTANESGTFQCSLDGAAFAVCTTPASYAGLADGAHTFQVRAVDAPGNVDATPASHTWTVDTAAPDTSITGGPSGTVNETSASFTFTATEGGATFACALDGAAFTACTSPKSYSGLAEGTHTFQVRATDVAANTDATAASRAWTIDLSAPDTTITGGPSQFDASTSATISFTSNDPTATFQCSLDGAPFTACSSPKTYTGLSEGPRTARVRAIDLVGNIDPSPASWSWTVDLAPPVVMIQSGPGSVAASSTATFTIWTSEPATLTCDLDGSSSVCTSPVTFSGLADGPHGLVVRAVDRAGHMNTQPAAWSWRIDTVVPDTTIDAGPPAFHASTQATIVFSATESDVTFRCQLDGAAYVTCTSPVAYSGLAEGAHTVRVFATDAAQNMDVSPAVRTFTVDVTAPDTSIIDAPPSLHNGSTAGFTFAATETDATFACALDGGAFAPCGQPHTVSGLADGAHTFEVRATDRAGNADTTTATHTWTIDTVPPETTISSAPPPRTRDRAAFVRFSSEAGATFTCSLDGAPYEACTSPVAYGDLADGPHQIAVVAIDRAGNLDPTVATSSWVIDTTAPNTVLDSGPVGTVGSTSAVFEFHADENGATFACSLDDAPFTACASAMFYDDLTPGGHSFQVQATDATGNPDATPATRTWTIDTDVADTAITSGPSGRVRETTSTFAFTSTENGATFRCSLDDAPFTACASPVVLTGLADGAHRFEVTSTANGVTDPTPATRAWTVDTVAPYVTISGGPDGPYGSRAATFTFAADEAAVSFACSVDGGAPAPCYSPHTVATEDGAHAFTVVATDDAGNAGTPGTTRTWTVDTTAPATRITGAPASPSRETAATFSFDADDPDAVFSCSLDGAPFAACTAPQVRGGLADGAHTFEVVARDAAGNTDPSPATHAWTVDTRASDTVVTERPPSVSASPSAGFAFAATESGATFRCALDGAPFTACTSPVVYDGLADGSHTFAVRSVDLAGNADPSPAEVAWRIDTSPPDTLISSGPAGTTRDTAAVFVLAATEQGATFACALDGGAYEPCLSRTTYAHLAAGVHTFEARATDAAGNTDAVPATFTWTVVDDDETAPVLTLLRPTPGIWVNDQLVAASVPSVVAAGPITVIVRAEDPQSSVDRVVFTVDGAPVPHAVVGESEYAYTLRDVLPGSHRVEMYALNGDGLSATTGVTIITTGR